MKKDNWERLIDLINAAPRDKQVRMIKSDSEFGRCVRMADAYGAWGYDGILYAFSKAISVFIPGIGMVTDDNIDSLLGAPNRCPVFGEAGCPASCPRTDLECDKWKAMTAAVFGLGDPVSSAAPKKVYCPAVGKEIDPCLNCSHEEGCVAAEKLQEFISAAPESIPILMIGNLTLPLAGIESWEIKYANGDEGNFKSDGKPYQVQFIKGEVVWRQES